MDGIPPSRGGTLVESVLLAGLGAVEGAVVTGVDELGVVPPGGVKVTSLTSIFGVEGGAGPITSGILGGDDTAGVDEVGVAPGGVKITSLTSIFGVERGAAGGVERTSLNSGGVDEVATKVGVVGVLVVVILGTADVGW